MPCISGRYCAFVSTCSARNFSGRRDLLILVVHIADERIQRPYHAA